MTAFLYFLLFITGSQRADASEDSVPECDVDDRGLCIPPEALSLLQNNFEVIKTNENEELGGKIQRVHQWLDKHRNQAVEGRNVIGFLTSSQMSGVKEFIVITLAIWGILFGIWITKDFDKEDMPRSDHDEQTAERTAAGPGSMEWKGISLQADDKVILDSVYGSVKSGEMACILGPSGSGKTTLLNILAGRMNTKAPNMEFSGDVSMGGTIVDPVAARTNIAYVMQEDALPAFSTPREILMMAVLLRNKEISLDNQDIQQQRVEKLLSELHLEKCADTYVGNALVKGLSGGEKKRVSAAVELITSPTMVILDEPLTGLDSQSALTVVEVLKGLASRNGCGVLCTVHQPPSEIFQMFDKMICLSHGRTVYCETVKGLSNYMLNLGAPVPDETNPADHIVFHLQTLSKQSLKSFEESWAAHEKVTELPLIESARSTGSKIPPCTTSKRNFNFQLHCLLQREMRLTFRNKFGLAIRFAVVAIMNLFFASLYRGVGSKVDLDGLHAHFGAVCSVMITTFFGAAQPVLLQFPSERPIFLREYTSEMYGIAPYFLAKTIVEIPLAFLTSLEAWLILYWILQFPGNFGVLVLISFGLTLSTASAALFLGCAVSTAESAVELLPLMLVPQVQFTGVFVNVSLIPAWLRWLQYLFPLKFAINLIAIEEFHTSELGLELLRQQDIVPGKAWLYVLLLVGSIVGFRALAMMSLRRRAAFVI